MSVEWKERGRPRKDPLTGAKIPNRTINGDEASWDEIVKELQTEVNVLTGVCRWVEGKVDFFESRGLPVGTLKGVLSGVDVVKAEFTVEMLTKQLEKAKQDLTQAKAKQAAAAAGTP